MRSVLLFVAGLLGGCALVADEGAAGNTAGGAAGQPEVTNPGSSGSAPACFTATEPAFITPREPTMTATAACTATGASKDTFASEHELLSFIVGSWVACGSSTSWFLSQPGFVIGGDGSFRFLESEGGSLRETEVLGRVKVIAVGDGHFQIDVEREEGTNILHITQIGSDRLDINETMGRGTFARIAPGSAAKPAGYVDSGACSLEGTWDSAAGVKDGFDKSAGTFAFDGRGHFVGGALGADVCSAPTITGTYRLVGDSFEIVTSTGMGCPSSYAAGWRVAFSDDCKTARLTMKYDNCTGARHSIEYDSVLTKK